MYTILKTGMGPLSGNVGDRLVLESAKKLIENETGVDSFLVYNRRTDLTSVLDKINSTTAVVMPAFEIRNGIVPHYRFADDISDIEVPLIPMGAGWQSFPGDIRDVNTHQYSSQAKHYLKHISDQVDTFTTRDRYTSMALQNSGISNTELVGDCAWYDLESLGEEMSQPSSVDKLVFTTPHRRLYLNQAKRVLNMLRDEFPDATLYCSLHNTPSDQDRILVDVAQRLGYELVRASLDTENIDFYEDCDLHVGYRLHGHIGFLQKRIPSILIHEDGRGAGLTHTLKIGGIDGFRRRLSPEAGEIVRSISDVKYFRWAQVVLDTDYTVEGWSNRVIAPADSSVPERIRSFVRSELDTGFASYRGVADVIDQTYEEHMRPFLQSLPR